MNETPALWRSRAREQFEALLEDIASEWDVRKEAAREQLAESLNQGLRRLRQTDAMEDAAALVLELTAPFASRCALFLFRDGRAEALGARGLGPLPLALSPDDGAAFRSAVEMRDPVVAIGTPSEISAELAERVGTETVERVYLYPATMRGEVKALLFAAGTVQPAPLELIAGLMAMRMESLTPAVAPKRADLVEIAGAVPPKSAKQSWTDLPPEAQALHLRAQRMARLRVSEMLLEHGDAVRAGVERGNLYASLRAPIDRAREEFGKEFVKASPTMVDYLYLELVRGLARNDDRLLGADFPGPLV